MPLKRSRRPGISCATSSGRCSRGAISRAPPDVWPRSNPFAGTTWPRAPSESALWDAEAKQKGMPLWKLLGGARQEIPCGVSIGIKATVEELIATVERELAAGYQRIKIKIKPGNDITPVERLRLQFPRIRLMVDANSAYRLEDWPHLKRLEAYYLMMIEQPLGLGRHLQPRGIAAQTRDTHLPRRMHPHRRACARRHRSRRLPHH